MRYLLMICTDEAAIEALSQEDESSVLAEYGAFETEIERRGVIQASARLRPTSDATTVQVHDGKVLISDGSFAETKEQIGGYCLIDCKDPDEAIGSSELES